MDITSSFHQRVFRCYWLPFTLMIWLMSSAFIPNALASPVERAGCEVALNKEAYREYLLSVDVERVERTQRELNQIAASRQILLNELVVDGVLGNETREALYTYCQSLKTVPVDNFVISLITKLDQQVALMAAVENTINDDELTAVSSEVPTTSPEVVPVATSHGAENRDAIAKEESVDSGPSVWYVLTKASLAKALEESQPADPSQSPPEEVDDGKDIKQDEGGEAVQEAVITVPDDEKTALLDAMLDIPYVNRAQFLRALRAKAGIDATEYDGFTEHLLKASKNVASTRLASMVMGDDSCGCVRDFSDTVYGFYPYWRSTISRDETSEDPAAGESEIPLIDYSVLNRIAYYGLTLEESGEIKTPLHWGVSGKLGNFINKAHRHKTEVDLVVYSDYWAQWNDSSLQASVASVYNQLMLTVSYKENGVMAYVPFFNRTQASPDGVTLHFDRYYDHPASRYKLVEFVSQLHERLEGDGRDYKINILLDIHADELKSSKKLFSDLKGLLVTDNSGVKPYVDSLLVFIDEPTTSSKKLLRSKIENEFSGAQRMAVLRKVVPVLQSGHLHHPRPL